MAEQNDSQGFATSALATDSVARCAEKVDGGYRVSGRKMWTSTAQVANKILLLARTVAKADARRSTDGITKLPAECRPFYELMQVAKLVPGS